MLLAKFIDLFIHLDVHLSTVMQEYGIWTYLILFLIIFCETGLVITPFLPGDSLLFATGALCVGGALQVENVLVLLGIAAVLGDTVNYAIGNFLGPKVLTGNSQHTKREVLGADTPLLREVWGKNDHFCAFRPHRTDVCPFSGGRRSDELLQVRVL